MPRHCSNPSNQRRHGAAAVELALLLPFLILMFVVSVDYARIFYYTQVVENCARNGAFYLSDPKAPANNLYSGVQQAALADAGGLNPQPTVRLEFGNRRIRQSVRFRHGRMAVQNDQRLSGSFRLGEHQSHCPNAPGPLTWKGPPVLCVDAKRTIAAVRPQLRSPLWDRRRACF